MLSVKGVQPSCLHGKISYEQFLNKLDQRDLEYLKKRLPQSKRVNEIIFNPDGSFIVHLTGDIKANVTRNGATIPGATLHLESEIEGCLTENGIEFVRGVSGSGLGLSASIKSMVADKTGRITVKAKGPLGIPVADSFHPNQEKSVAGGLIKFDPKSIGVKYEAVPSEKAEPNHEYRHVSQEEKKRPSLINKYISWFFGKQI